mmetsp:Transcript_1720/g.5642  ORF Transcript_1720/g.5642 Transcript_1720/m.5642 type:complete len:256 (+) Transcript_1720:42-809(+)
MLAVPWCKLPFECGDGHLQGRGRRVGVGGHVRVVREKGSRVSLQCLHEGGVLWAAVPARALAGPQGGVCPLGPGGGGCSGRRRHTVQQQSECLRGGAAGEAAEGEGRGVQAPPRSHEQGTYATGPARGHGAEETKARRGLPALHGEPPAKHAAEASSVRTWRHGPCRRLRTCGGHTAAGGARGFGLPGALRALHAELRSSPGTAPAKAASHTADGADQPAEGFEPLSQTGGNTLREEVLLGGDALEAALAQGQAH